jgi:hypothetical protein
VRVTAVMMAMACHRLIGREDDVRHGGQFRL